MNFAVNVDETSGSRAVVSVHGEIDLHTAPRVQTTIDEAVQNGIGVVVVDMSDIAFMDSTALSTFMRIKDTLQERGVSLRLATPSHAVERIFSVTGFGDYFEVFPSREAATSV